MSFLRREQPIAKETLEQLYVQEKKSMQEIADELGCSVHKST
jgi:DNA-binding CsgD family transcriptional regulator